MIAKYKLTKVTLKHNDDEIIVFLGWHFVIIIMLIKMIKTIMKGELWEWTKHTETKGVQLSFCLPLLQYDFFHIKLGICTNPRDLWKLQLIDGVFYIHRSFCFSKLKWEDKVIYANLFIYTGDCFPIGFEIDDQLPDAKHQYTICTDTQFQGSLA